MDENLVTALKGRPPLVVESPDLFLYQHIVHRMRDGEGYYEASRNVLRIRNRLSPAKIDLASPLSHRPPTLYALLALLPAGLPAILLSLAMGAAASVAAYPMVRVYAPSAVALAASLVVAVMTSSMTSGIVFFGTEYWAGLLGLCSLAAFCVASSRWGTPPARRFLLLSAGLALVATLFRELGVAYLIVGLVASVADSRMRRDGAWQPWVMSLALVTLALTAHVVAAGPWLEPTPGGARTSLASWLHFDALGLPAAMVLGALALGNLPVPAAWLTGALGVLGAAAVPHRTAERVAIGMYAIGGTIALTFLYPSGVSSDGLPPGTWSPLVLPSLMACAPLGAWWLYAQLAARRRRIPTAATPSEPTP